MSHPQSGVLLHITSLPSSYGIGDLGPSAHAFADALNRANQAYWQLLPLNPTRPVFGNSPYSSPSAFAGNTLLISPELLVEDGLLEPEECRAPGEFPADRVDYRPVARFKQGLFRKAVKRFRAQALQAGQDYQGFCRANAGWLDDYALFEACCGHFHTAWENWPVAIRNHREKGLATYRKELAQAIETHKILQFLFDRQWTAFKAHCNARGIQLIGDIPLYVSYQSADVWAHPGLFQLDRQRLPVAVAGVPPDYFSETGQRWGNPLFDWGALEETKYAWWRARIARNASMVDLARLDHFRGFAGYWSVPVHEETAINGHWMPGPGAAFFQAIRSAAKVKGKGKGTGSGLPFIAEDLGIITDDVVALRKRFKMPGMRVLQFGLDCLDDEDCCHLPHRYPEHCVAYTGTHDNDTLMGWFQAQPATGQTRVLEYARKQGARGKDIHWQLIRLLLRSRAGKAIIPMQDILGLNGGSRMNTPAKPRGNWAWRMTPDQMAWTALKPLKEATQRAGRGSSRDRVKEQAMQS